MPEQGIEQHASGSEPTILSTQAVKRSVHDSQTDGEDVVDATVEQPLPKKAMVSHALGASLETIAYDSAVTKPETSSQSPNMVTPPTILNFSLQADPYEINPRLTLDYISKFYSFVDQRVSAAIPRALFLPWVKTCKVKTLSDKMMIYSVLALGSVFADASTSDTNSEVFPATAQEGLIVCTDNLSFQLAATYLLSTLLFISKGEHNKAWNICGSAMRTLFGLQFNREASVRTAPRSGSWESLLDTGNMVECRRSLTWAAVVIECLNGCYKTPFRTTPWTDYDLCLPGTQKPFQFGVSFNPASLRHPTGSGRDCPKADIPESSRTFGHLIHLATIFHEVANFSHQQRYSSTSDDTGSFRSFHSEVERRLHFWKTSLHAHQELSGEKMACRDLEILYHCTNIHLHRYIRHAKLDSSEITGHVKATLTHAYRTLELVQCLNGNEKTKISLSEFKITSPCIEYAIMTAVDVLTAAGNLTDLTNTDKIMSVISSGLEVLDDLARFSASAQRQRDMVKRRLMTMLRPITRRTWDQRRAFYFKDPILSRYGMDQDIVYGIMRTQYFQAMGSRETFTADDLYELTDRS